MDEFRTPDADAKSENELAVAGTGAMTKDVTEGSHAMMSDINVQELQSASAGLVTASMATLKAGLDQVHLARATNAALIDNIVNTNAAHLNNLVNSASHRHSELAADRQWNLDEQPAWFSVLLDAVAETMNKD